MLVIQKKEEGEFSFGIEDLPYYVKKARDQQFDLDFGIVKKYFPINLALSGIFKIYQDLFGNFVHVFWWRHDFDPLSSYIIVYFLCLLQA